MITSATTIDSISSLGAARPVTRDRIIDHAERLGLLALYVWLAMRLIRGYQTDGKLPNLLLLPSEGIVLVLMLMRKRAIQISRHPGEWLLSAVGTGLPLMVLPVSTRALIPHSAGTTMLVMGLLIRSTRRSLWDEASGVCPPTVGSNPPDPINSSATRCMPDI